MAPHLGGRPQSASPGYGHMVQVGPEEGEQTRTQQVAASMHKKRGGAREQTMEHYARQGLSPGNVRWVHHAAGS